MKNPAPKCRGQNHIFLKGCACQIPLWQMPLQSPQSPQVFQMWRRGRVFSSQCALFMCLWRWWHLSIIRLKLETTSLQSWPPFEGYVRLLVSGFYKWWPALHSSAGGGNKGRQYLGNHCFCLAVLGKKAQLVLGFYFSSRLSSLAIFCSVDWESMWIFILFWLVMPVYLVLPFLWGVNHALREKD